MPELTYYAVSSGWYVGRQVKVCPRSARSGNARANWSDSKKSGQFLTPLVRSLNSVNQNQKEDGRIVHGAGIIGIYDEPEVVLGCRGVYQGGYVNRADPAIRGAIQIDQSQGGLRGEVNPVSVPSACLL